MFSSLVALGFAILVPGLSPPPADSSIRPTGFTRQTQAGGGRSGSGHGHASASAEAVSCRKFVDEFYAWYVAKSKSGDPLPIALKQKRANFSLELIANLNEEFKAAAKTPGDIVGLDFDPLYNGQNYLDKYVPGKVTQKGDRFLVEVFGVSSGMKNDAPTVTPELKHERGRWVFMNFHYKNDGEPDDLLGILKRLKADRKKRP